ncbi:MAG: hypothetical protein AB4372_13210, partial [Xenococcus sp. (in: cyanobacteria)]
PPPLLIIRRPPRFTLSFFRRLSQIFIRDRLLNMLEFFRQHSLVLKMRSRIPSDITKLLAIRC